MHSGCSNLPDRVLGLNNLQAHTVSGSQICFCQKKKRRLGSKAIRSFIILALTCIIVIITIVIIFTTKSVSVLQCDDNTCEAPRVGRQAGGNGKQRHESCCMSHRLHPVPRKSSVGTPT